MQSGQPSDKHPCALGHYRIADVIGEGGMGIVYRARDTVLERDVALKRLRPDRFSGPESRQRLMHEARAASRLSHPNIVRVFDVFESDEALWIVMELVGGRSLRRHLREQGALGADEVVRYADDLAGALAAAHSEHVLHRDINPNNILIGIDGRAHLTDFGVACTYVPAGEESETTTRSLTASREGQVVGTPGYMSPEQVLGRRPDPRSDIFSLGLVLYEMCTGHAAFQKTPDGNVYDAILHHVPTAIGHLNHQIPGELVRIVQKAINKRPEERYQHASDMQADLRHLRRTMESEEPGAAGGVEKDGHALRGVVIAASATAIVVVMAFAAWFAVRRSDSWQLPETISRQLTSARGWEAEPAISPDGTLIAYTSDRSGNADIWLVDAKGGDPLRLTDSPAEDRKPAWFPDASFVAFASDRGGGSAIYKIPRLGGAAMLLVPNATDPAISPNGRWIAFARTNEGGLFRINVAPLGEPGDARALTGDADGTWNHRNPAWSPDETSLAYEDNHCLWIVPLAGGRARRLTTEDGDDGSPVWSPDGRHLYFSSTRTGGRALWRVAAEGGALTRLTPGAGPETGPSLSADGRRLVYSTYANDYDAALFDLRSGTRTRIGGVRDELEPALSPDADRILYVSNREGVDQLWLQPLVDGRPQGVPRKMTDLSGGVGRPGFSPDGSWISFHRVMGGQRDVWVMPADGGPPVRFTNDPAPDVHPAWAPDGHTIAFASERDGPSHIWAAPVSGGRPSGPARRLTWGPCQDWFPAWSPDGSSIAFMRTCHEETDVWVARADGRTEPRQLTTVGNVQHHTWNLQDGLLLVRARWTAGSTEVRKVAPDSGRVIPFVPPLVCGSESSYGTVNVSRNGRYLATMLADTRGNLWMLEAVAGSF